MGIENRVEERLDRVQEGGRSRSRSRRIKISQFRLKISGNILDQNQYFIGRGREREERIKEFIPLLRYKWELFILKELEGLPRIAQNKFNSFFKFIQFTKLFDFVLFDGKIVKFLRLRDAWINGRLTEMNSQEVLNFIQLQNDFLLIVNQISEIFNDFCSF